jgi:hypothetical protein
MATSKNDMVAGTAFVGFSVGFSPTETTENAGTQPTCFSVRTSQNHIYFKGFWVAELGTITPWAEYFSSAPGDRFIHRTVPPLFIGGEAVRYGSQRQRKAPENRTRWSLGRCHGHFDALEPEADPAISPCLRLRWHWPTAALILRISVWRGRRNVSPPDN